LAQVFMPPWRLKLFLSSKLYKLLSKLSCLRTIKVPTIFSWGTRSSPNRMNKKGQLPIRNPLNIFIGILGPFAKVYIILLIVKCCMY
jgi:hypothetical protein